MVCLLIPHPALGWASLNWAADFPEGFKNLIILKILTSVRFVVLAYKYWLELSQGLSTPLWLKISSKQTTGLQKFYFLEKTSQKQHADNWGLRSTPVHRQVWPTRAEVSRKLSTGFIQLWIQLSMLLSSVTPSWPPLFPSSTLTGNCLKSSGEMLQHLCVIKMHNKMSFNVRDTERECVLRGRGHIKIYSLITAARWKQWKTLQYLIKRAQDRRNYYLARYH